MSEYFRQDSRAGRFKPAVAIAAVLAVVLAAATAAVLLAREDGRMGTTERESSSEPPATEDKVKNRPEPEPADDSRPIAGDPEPEPEPADDSRPPADNPEPKPLADDSRPTAGDPEPEPEPADDSRPTAGDPEPKPPADDSRPTAGDPEPEPPPASGPTTDQQAEQALRQLIPWYASPRNYGQTLIKYPLREVYMKDAGLGRQVAEAAWLRDGVDVFDSDVVYGLQHLLDYDLSQTPRTDLAGRMLAASLRQPLRTSNIHAIKALGNIKFLNPAAFKKLIGQDWFGDGLTAEELAFIMTLESNIWATDLYSDLLADRYAQSKTIDLPHNGPTKIWLFYHEPFEAGNNILSLIEDGLRASDNLFKTDLLLTDVVVLLVDASDYPDEAAEGGVNFGDSMLIIRNSDPAYADRTWTSVVYHETAHFYFVGRLHSDTLWLPEGGADFAAEYTASWKAGGVWPRSLTPDRLGRTAYCEEAYSATKIVHLKKQRGGCEYILGEYFLTHIFNAIGGPAFSSALREMFINHAAFEYHARHGVRGEGQTEERIYQTFLKHTPAEKRRAFKELYRRLHGGSFVD